MTTAAHYAAVADHKRRIFALYEGLTIKSRQMNQRRRGPDEWARGYELWSDNQKVCGSSIGDDEIRMFYEIADLIGMTSAYTIGTAFGLSTFALALARPEATVYAIDDYSEREVTARKYALPLVRKIIQERCPNVRLHVGRSPEDTPAALDGLDGSLGLVFIDALHKDHAAAADYRGTAPFLDETSVVLWHDVDRTMGAFRDCFRGSPFDRAERLHSYSSMAIYYSSRVRPDLEEYLGAATWRVLEPLK